MENDSIEQVIPYLWACIIGNHCEEIKTLRAVKSPDGKSFLVSFRIETENRKSHGVKFTVPKGTPEKMCENFCIQICNAQEDYEERVEKREKKLSGTPEEYKLDDMYEIENAFDNLSIHVMTASNVYPVEECKRQGLFTRPA